MITLDLFRHPWTRHPRSSVWPTYSTDILSVSADQNLSPHQSELLKYYVQPNSALAHNNIHTSRLQTTHHFLREAHRLHRSKSGAARHRPKCQAWDRGMFTHAAWLPRPGRAVCLHTPRGKNALLEQPRPHSGQHVAHEEPKQPPTSAQGTIY